MINNNSSSCRNCMALLRLVVLQGMVHNMCIFAKHVGTKDNGIADSLSRLDFVRFNKLKAKRCMEEYPTEIPHIMWPIEKIWLLKD